MAMKRGAGGVGTPDVLQKLGRPGFPSGMKVLLVDTAKERQEIVDQMQKLGYQGMMWLLPAWHLHGKGDLSGQLIPVHILTSANCLLVILNIEPSQRYMSRQRRKNILLRCPWGGFPFTADCTYDHLIATVTSCNSCSQARVLLSSKAAGLYDIVLAEVRCPAPL